MHTWCSQNLDRYSRRQVFIALVSRRLIFSPGRSGRPFEVGQDQPEKYYALCIVDIPTFLPFFSLFRAKQFRRSLRWACPLTRSCPCGWCCACGSPTLRTNWTSGSRPALTSTQPGSLWRSRAAKTTTFPSSDAATSWIGALVVLGNLMYPGVIAEAMCLYCRRSSWWHPPAQPIHGCVKHLPRRAVLHLDNPRAVCLPDHGPAAGHAGFTEGSEEARLMKEVFRATGNQVPGSAVVEFGGDFFQGRWNRSNGRGLYSWALKRQFFYCLLPPCGKRFRIMYEREKKGSSWMEEAWG